MVTNAFPAMSRGEPQVPRRDGGNLDDLRRRNLSSVLRAVHLRNGSTRAEITHETGLNRSTVRALVGDLVHAGIVFQEEPASAGVVGRPSPSVHASDAVRVLAVNPETDATVGAIVGIGGRVLARAEVRHATSPSPDDVIDAVGELIARLAPEGGLRGIGVAVPGLVDRASGNVVIAPHLGWQNVPLADRLTTAYGGRVVVDNDANCGVVAESLFGAARGHETLVYLNGGASGIGGSVITGGALLTGAHGYAGEFGHTLVNTGGRLCDCGASGCLETEVTRSRLLAALPDTSPSDLERSLVSQSQIDGRRAPTADEVSPGAVEADRQLAFLGVALRAIVNTIDPEQILLGGFLASMVKARGLSIIESQLAHALPGVKNDVHVTIAELGDDILTVGAAQLVLREVIEDPLGSLPRAS